jgi:hypothetical protein
VEPAPAALLPAGASPALLRPPATKSESGCSDPPGHQTRPRGQDGDACEREPLGQVNRSFASGTDKLRPYPHPPDRSAAGPIFACLTLSRAGHGMSPRSTSRREPKVWRTKGARQADILLYGAIVAGPAKASKKHHIPLLGLTRRLGHGATSSAAGMRSACSGWAKRWRCTASS